MLTRKQPGSIRLDTRDVLDEFRCEHRLQVDRPPLRVLALEQLTGIQCCTHVRHVLTNGVVLGGVICLGDSIGLGLGMGLR